jgi:membrane protein YqaA with SNARE-associated domain
MEIVASNAYLAVFGAGTVIGATSTYFLLKFLKKPPNEVWKPGMEESLTTLATSIA